MTIGVAVFGATGSIGESTLSVIEEHPDHFNLEVVSAHSSVDKLIRVIERFIFRERPYLSLLERLNVKTLTTSVQSTSAMSVFTAILFDSLKIMLSPNPAILN